MGNNKLRKVTLCILFDKDRVLLAMKKRGFGVGKWNGAGGKLKDGETIEEAMLRETKEEINVLPVEYYEAAVIDFFFDGKEEFNQEMHAFLCKKWEGEPSESEEMLPKWFDINSIPFNEMWEDDRIWIPYVLEGRKIEANFKFDKSEKIKEINLKMKS
jgi:8-oxo-dGTP pyrophosphatase MutT (NUDIX family)